MSRTFINNFNQSIYRMRHETISCVCAFIIANIADVLSTQRAFALGLHELNPLILALSALIHGTPMDGIITMKLFAIVGVIGATKVNKISNYVPIACFVMAAVIGAVSVLNITAILH